jgi:lipoprotein-anchoring transpeptidase ErfK/SrfK
MKIDLRLLITTLILLAAVMNGCIANNTNNGPATVQSTPSPSGSPQPQTEPSRSQLTLPVLDALLANDVFVSELKTKVQVTDEQVNALKTAAAEEVNRLRTGNAEQNVANSTEGRSRATEQIARIIGDDKTKQLVKFADEFWARGADAEGATSKQDTSAISTTPNAVPTDTRIVVNIPAYRMDLFKDGSLIKSYKIGIGYPEFPLPQGLRKAQTIIFNPTWTPPDSPWVANMKNITPGEKVDAGSKLNPLGPIKIPIGMPSLIHGGKSPAKLGTFASHGCVGLTNSQVKDFAQMLGQISNTDVSANSITNYLKDPTHTQVVKLKQTIPVELRYETIVLEDGKLHIFKDVYEQDSNTEENLRKVLEANGSGLEDLSQEERSQVLDALNLMSAHPKQTVVSPSPTPATDAAERKRKRTDKKPPKNQKEMVVELTSLARRGYPAPENFDAGTGKPVTTSSAR